MSQIAFSNSYSNVNLSTCKLANVAVNLPQIRKNKTTQKYLCLHYPIFFFYVMGKTFSECISYKNNFFLFLQQSPSL